ncbi:hypothetical protein FO519_004669 [Halicephalobus sp. NKZ332]|nr:hypothetical protein FO519_004669 [Halicephalobus sp. NKZ332]
MDSNIKKELIDETNQSDIKKEELFPHHPTMSAQASGFSSTIKVDADVKVHVGQYGIQITEGTTIHDFYHDRRVYKAENISNSRNKFALNGLQQQGMNINGQQTTVSTNLTLIFDDYEESVKFHQQLRQQHYNPGV